MKKDMPLPVYKLTIFDIQPIIGGLNGAYLNFSYLKNHIVSNLLFYFNFLDTSIKLIPWQLLKYSV